jgi:hypothetical protein
LHPKTLCLGQQRASHVVNSLSLQLRALLVGPAQSQQRAGELLLLCMCGNGVQSGFELTSIKPAKPLRCWADNSSHPNAEYPRPESSLPKQQPIVEKSGPDRQEMYYMPMLLLDLLISSFNNQQPVAAARCLVYTRQQKASSTYCAMLVEVCCAAGTQTA